MMHANTYREWLIVALFGAAVGGVLGLGQGLGMAGGRYDAFQHETYDDPHAHEPPPEDYRVVLPEDRLLPGWAWWTLAGAGGGFLLAAWCGRPWWLLNLSSYRDYRREWCEWERQRDAAIRRVEQIQDPHRRAIEADAAGRRLALTRPDRRL